MSSLSTVYTEEQRIQCYDCSSSQELKVAGEKRKLECRKYNDQGIIFEQRMTAEANELVDEGVVQILENGVDTSEFSYSPHWRFDVQSRGGGGAAKNECKADYQQAEYINYKKYGYTEMLYVKYKTCPKSFIGTELQDVVFSSDQLGDAYNPDNALTDGIIMSARRDVAKAVKMNDVVGVFGGANPEANSYDGVLAQAYWAYTGFAYAQSLKFTVDTAVLVDGTYLHVKYAGVQKSLDILFDSTLPTDASIDRFATRAEVYQRVVDFHNNEVLKENGNRYVDATYSGNDIFITSKYAEKLVYTKMFVDGNADVEDWTACNAAGQGITIELLQNNMPIDERPWLVKYRRYTIDNILKDLHLDVHNATVEMDMGLMLPGQEMALVIDPTVWKNYRFALKDRPQEATNYNLEDDFKIVQSTALHNTGLWFITVWSGNESLRNIAHLVDAIGAADGDLAIITHISEDCEELKVKYETLHGVMVKDFRLFASNLLCSPFVENLQQPYESTLKVLPCYDKRVRERFIDPITSAQGCIVRANFEITNEYINDALYALPDGAGGYNIDVLEQGESLPAGSFPVYEVQLMDKTTGIPAGEVATYEYTVTFDDGTQQVYSSQNPVIQFVNDMAGITFDVQQSVTAASCSDVFIASRFYDAQYPFELIGGCNDITVALGGTLFRSPDYVIDGATWGSNINVFVNGAAAVIDMSAATNITEAAAEIEAWATDNGYVVSTAIDGTTLTVTSQEVIFIDNAALETFANAKLITIEDNTAWVSPDDLASSSFTVRDTAAGAGTLLASFSELPSQGDVTESGTGDYFIDGQVLSQLGCTFELIETAAVTFADADYYVNFTLSNV